VRDFVVHRGFLVIMADELSCFTCFLVKMIALVVVCVGGDDDDEVLDVLIGVDVSVVCLFFL